MCKPLAWLLGKEQQSFGKYQEFSRAGAKLMVTSKANGAGECMLDAWCIMVIKFNSDSESLKQTDYSRNPLGPNEGFGWLGKVICILVGRAHSLGSYLFMLT